MAPLSRTSSLWRVAAESWRVFTPPTFTVLSGFDSFTLHSRAVCMLETPKLAFSWGKGTTQTSWMNQKTRWFWRCSSKKTKRRGPPLRDKMMSAVETSVYRPAQLLSWVYMSLEDTPDSSVDGFKDEKDISAQSKRSASEMTSNYLSNFFHLNSEVETLCMINGNTLCFYFLQKSIF